MAIFSVLYPASEGARFDKLYYHQTHIPLVLKSFRETGLVDVQVQHGVAAADGGPPPFVAMAHISFRDAEALQASLTSAKAQAVFADLANFTNITPVTQVSAAAEGALHGA